MPSKSTTRNCSWCGSPVKEPKVCCSHRCDALLRHRKAEQELNLSAFDTWTPEMAYALGLMYSDGCLRRVSPHVWQISFSNTDKETVEWWHAFVGAKSSITIGLRPNRQVAYHSAIRSNTLASKLQELGVVPRKSWADFHLPAVPTAEMPHFLRGLVDGDGSINISTQGNRPRFSANVTSNSPLFREDLCNLFSSLGWHASNCVITVTLGGAHAEHLCQYLYGVEGPCMKRKRGTWEKWQILREPFGGLICTTDAHACLRGLRPQPWHDLVGTMTDPSLAALVDLHPSRVFKVRQQLGVPAFCG